MDYSKMKKAELISLLEERDSVAEVLPIVEATERAVASLGELNEWQSAKASALLMVARQMVDPEARPSDIPGLERSWSVLVELLSPKETDDEDFAEELRRQSSIRLVS